MSRKLSKLETATLAIAWRNRQAAGRNTNDVDVTPEEVLEKYFDFKLQPATVGVDDVASEPFCADRNLAVRYDRAENAVWTAMCRLEDCGLLDSFWHAVGGKIWCTGARLTAKGQERATIAVSDS